MTADIIQVHPFRISNGRVEHLVLRRAVSDALCPGAWQVITGTVHDGELVRDAAIRELAEESSLETNRWHVIPRVAAFYFEPLDAVVLSPIIACEVDAAAPVVVSAEHEEYLWLPLGAAIDRLEFDSQIEGARLVEASVQMRGGPHGGGE